jgi:hypothetical protein
MHKKMILLMAATISLGASCTAQLGLDVTSHTTATGYANGRTALHQKNIQPAITYTLDVSKLAAGSYIMNVKNDAITYTEKIIITH